MWVRGTIAKSARDSSFSIKCWKFKWTNDNVLCRGNILPKKFLAKHLIHEIRTKFHPYFRTGYHVDAQRSRRWASKRGRAYRSHRLICGWSQRLNFKRSCSKSTLDAVWNHVVYLSKASYNFLIVNIFFVWGDSFEKVLVICKAEIGFATKNKV